MSTSGKGATARVSMKPVPDIALRNDDPFLRQGTAVSRFFKRYRMMPLPARMFGIFLMGFTLGLIIETFACKTHLYESVMSKKDTRRHDFDEFVVDFRQKVETWQRQDQEKAK